MDHDTEDSPQSRWRISKDIPVVWLLGGAVAVVLSFAQTYAGQLRVIEKINEMSITLNTLSAQAGKKDMKDVEHDLRISDHERRLLVLEQRKEAKE